MNLQVLLSTMNQADSSFLNRMKINSDAIIINQGDFNDFSEINYKGHRVRLFSFKERGVGLSRNNALMRADADICLFADDDIIYVENYQEIILSSFNNNPKADVIIFNVPSLNQERPTYIIKKCGRVRWYNCLRYGAVKIAVRTEKIKRANIYFSLLFGGGAKYSDGEDSMFVAECLRKGLRVYTDNRIIGYVSQADSTWFKGYTEKYFVDKGIFFYLLSKRWARLLCLQFALRHWKLFERNMNLINALSLMNKGIKTVRG